MALTKLEEEPYEYYLNRVKANSIALKVKVADLRDNLDSGRITHPTEKDFGRIKKYDRAFDTCESAIAACKKIAVTHN